MSKARFVNNKVMGALKLVEAGLPVADLCREVGIRWITQMAKFPTNPIRRCCYEF